MSRRNVTTWAATLLPVLAGCNPGKMLSLGFLGGSSEAIRLAAPPLGTADATWHGWSAIEQTNGLLTVRHVPAAGGRTLSLEINGDDAFLVMPAQRGKAYPADSRNTSVHFGGHYTCIGPEMKWSVNDQPFNPHAGPYQVARETSLEDRHVLKMASRTGTWKGATIAIERTLTMYRGNTHIVIAERVSNRGPDDLDFYIWDFTQIDARDRRKPEGELRPLTFYLPVPRRGVKKDYHSFLGSDPRMNAQFNESLPADVLAVDFAAVQFKIASQAGEWWIACVDRDTGWTYVKVFDVTGEGRYVDGNGPVELYGSNMNNPLPFVEMELLTPMQRCRRGAAIEQREHWYASTCKGPVLAFTPVGLVCENLTVVPEKQYYDVAGRFAVFHLGSVRLKVVDRKDEVLFEGDPIRIDPREELKLSQTLPARPGADRILLEVYDFQAHKVGELARVNLR